MRNKSLARALSVLGHPAIILPLAISIRSTAINAPALSQWFLIALSIILAGGITLYSWIAVRRGKWDHIDASNKLERVELNLILLAILFVCSIGAALLDKSRLIPFGLFIIGCIIGAALLFRKHLKVSLHTSFAVFASFLLWPSSFYMIGGLVLSSAIGWSRIVLGRHTNWEVLVGALIGGAAGTALLFVLLYLTL